MKNKLIWQEQAFSSRISPKTINYIDRVRQTHLGFYSGALSEPPEKE